MINYIKYNSARANKYQIVTTIDFENGASYKKAAHDEGNLFLHSIMDSYKALQIAGLPMTIVKPKREGDAIKFPFIRGDSLDAQLFRAVLEKSMSASLLLGIPIVLGGLILGGELIPFLFGEQYLSSVLTFRILLLTILMGASAALIGNALISSGEQKVFAVYTTIGALTNVLLNVILIPRYGIVGAAIATILSQVLINSLFLLKMKRINYFVILPYLKRIIISGTSMSILTFGIMQLGVSVIINILISAIFYFLLLKFLNEPLLKDAWSIIRSK